MARGSQVGNLQDIDAGDVAGLVHEVFAEGVKPSLRAVSPILQIFQQAGPGKYRIDGEKIKWSTQLKQAHGAMASDGNLPDHAYTDPAEGETTPARRYVRRAVDNLEELRGRGPGAYDSFIDTVFDQQWEAFKRAAIRHAIGTSDGTLCKVASRSSATQFTVDDGYGHTGTDPLMHLEEGMVIAWVDVSDSNNVAGAAKISSINYSNNTITVDDGSTWEPGNNTADGDLIVAATTPDITTDYFASEFQNAPSGIWDIVDPDSNSSTVFGISESTYPRWQPYREASSTFDHLEVTDHWRKLMAKSNEPVTPQSHTAVASPGVVTELAHTLDGYQQQQNMGRTFQGGYQAVRIAGKDIVEDIWFPHDVLVTLCYEDMFKADLDGEASEFAEDGSMFSRLSDFDGKEWFVREYLQCFADRRNRLAALTGITLSNSSATDYSPTPNY